MNGVRTKVSRIRSKMDRWLNLWIHRKVYKIDGWMDSCMDG